MQVDGDFWKKFREQVKIYCTNVEDRSQGRRSSGFYKSYRTRSRYRQRKVFVASIWLYVAKTRRFSKSGKKAS